MTPTILALGGEPAPDDLLLELTGRREPRVLFLPTASGDPAPSIADFHQRFGGRGCRVEHLSLFRLHGSTRSVSDIVLDQDLVYVGGGSLRNLLAIWRAHGLDETFREAWRRGIVLAGFSAGAMCWFEAGVTRSGGPPEPIEGLGLIGGSFSVHADTEPERLPVYREAVRAGVLPGGWAADDGVGLLFRGRALERIVAARPGATARRVDPAGEWTLVPEVVDAREAPVDEDVRELRRVARLRGGHGARPWR